MRLASRKYRDMSGYFTNGSNWLQLRPPVLNIHSDSKPTRTPPVKEKTKKQSYDVHIVWELDYFLSKDFV
ncbi:hypothetical protein ES703_72335 [subsurface metagenome]